MANLIKDVMTADTVTLPADARISDAARAMRDRNIGDVIVMRGDRVAGILTDRDIVLRVIAEGLAPDATMLEDVATSDDLVTLSPDDDVADAVALMRERAIRRVPVVEGNQPVGFVSIGDLAVEQDPRSALADISSAPPNR